MRSSSICTGAARGGSLLHVCGLRRRLRRSVMSHGRRFGLHIVMQIDLQIAR